MFESVVEILEDNHITQSLPDSCASASLAMLMSMPESVVIEEFHTRYKQQQLAVSNYLNEKEVNFRRCYTDERSAKENCVYMLCLPSLNMPKGSHSIIGVSDEDGIIMRLFDPAKGREGRKYYSEQGVDTEKNELIPMEEDQETTGAFEYEIEITHSEFLRLYNLNRGLNYGNS